MRDIIERLYETGNVTDDELIRLITSSEETSFLFQKADARRREYYGTDVYIRGLIEISSYCKNDCYYCGIRRSNLKAERYRLSKEEILACCRGGYALGFRTFVMQGGEDSVYTDDFLCGIIQAIKGDYPDCAVTLSLGERSRESYQRLYDAGADRYLLRHETADEALYAKLHPAELSLSSRKACLWDLKEIGYQVGAGFMVEPPFQKPEHLLEDLRFLQELKPDMIGIGPFVPHHETPFADYKAGSLQLCLRLLAIVRLMFPYVLLPATTALGTIDPSGREKGIGAGANVVMPNLSPVSVRKKYELYDHKICTGEEAAECLQCLDARVRCAGYQIVTARGDVLR